MRWLQRRKHERDLDCELRSDLELEVEEQRESGLSPEEARYAARRVFGNTTLVKEEIREVWSWIWFERRVQDLQYAFRVLRKVPTFTAVAILSLALGIGANTGIYSILHALVLRNLPVSDPEKLVVITRNENVSSPYPLFIDFRDHSQTLAGVLAFRTAAMRFNTSGETERIVGELVSGTYFGVLGIRPLIGTAITNEDDRIPDSGGQRGPVVVLSYRFWLRRFGGRADAVGTRILLNDHPFMIVGVGPPGFDGTEIGEPADLFAPMTMQATLLPGLGTALTQPQSQWLRIFGRLKPEVDLRQAETELTTLLRRYNKEILGTGSDKNPDKKRSLLEQRVVLLPGSTGISQLRSQYSKPLWVLSLIVALVLLIACANVAGLMLNRATSRSREIAIRLSLGATRSRLISQLFAESLLLAIAGAGSGLLLARWIRDMLIGYLPAARSLNVPMEPAVLLFTLVLSAGAALVFGIAPALQGTRVDVAPVIQSGKMATRPGRMLFRKGLVIFQISLSCLLLITAALFLRTLFSLLTVDPGFARANILVASVESGPGLDSRLLKEVKYLPGVVSAALADSPPLHFHTEWTIYVPGYTPRVSGESSEVGFVSPDYFTTMGIPLLLGRDIDGHDISGARDVMVVNETFVRRYFPGENPVGRMIGTEEGVYQWEIIGVVKDSKYTNLREVPMPIIYVPARPGPWASRTVVHLRTAGNPAALGSALRQKIHDLDKAAAVFDVHTIQDELERSLLPERLMGAITALFGALALILAAIGLYGVISYAVGRRTREFGIRIAIGAKSNSILGLVIGEALWLLIGGTAVGTVAAWLLGRAVRGMLFGIEPMDLLSNAVAVLVLVVPALMAAWVPAWRASHVDPMVALRYE